MPTSPPPELRRSYQSLPEAFAPISRAVDLGEISARAAYQVIRVAWTLARPRGHHPPPAPRNAARRSPFNSEQR